MTAITADCSQQGARKEVTLETHAQVLQACVELRSAAQRSRTGARGPARQPPYKSAPPKPDRGAGEGSFSLGDSIEKVVPGREGSKGERPWRDSRVRGGYQTMRGCSLCHMHASLGPGAGAGLHRDFDVLSQQQQEPHQQLQREAGETPAKKG